MTERLAGLPSKPGADILDVCCGPRMFYGPESKDRTDVIYMDIRRADLEYTHKDSGTVSEWHIDPDIIGDFRDIPFESDMFSLVVFDPPHIHRESDSGIIVQKYGKLTAEWKDDLRRGFRECMRVCRPGGFVNFKWSESEIPMSEVSPLFPCPPMYYQRRGAQRSGYWAMFRKGGC